jgi:hypothetical protein
MEVCYWALLFMPLVILQHLLNAFVQLTKKTSVLLGVSSVVVSLTVGEEAPLSLPVASSLAATPSNCRASLLSVHILCGFALLRFAAREIWLVFPSFMDRCLFIAIVRRWNATYIDTEPPSLDIVVRSSISDEAMQNLIRKEVELVRSSCGCRPM